MFNNDVTQTYNFQDASQDIIIMLLGAFLLGCLLTWLLNKLFSSNYEVENSTYHYDNNDKRVSAINQQKVTPADTTSDVRIVKTPTNKPIRAVPASDNLRKISGIDSNTQLELKKQGITSFTELRDIKTKDLKAFQSKRETHKRVIETWPHQASLAAKGDWDKLTDYQNFIQRAQVASKVTKEADDLKVIEGINPEIENILNTKEIYTFKQLSHIDSDILKKHIVDANPSLDKNDTETWAHQAAMAEKEQWDELKIYQEFMHSDSDMSDTNTDINVDISPVASNTNELLNEEQNLSDHDDLKKIDGIGPKIEEVLNKAGIYTFSQLYNSDRSRLRNLLDDAGTRFKMHDPHSWPHQAGMADRSEWNDLRSYQNSINKELSNTLNERNSDIDEKEKNNFSSTRNVESVTQGNDDLKKIEGIGPKIEELLNNAGISTFEKLSKTSRDSIKKLLNEAGPQFRMHEPESWPHQAKLAAKSEWNELEKYQDFLIGGRE